MPIGPSMLSLVASGLYASVVLACLAAAFTARGSRQLHGHVWTWLLLALFFALLVALRLLDIEEIVRNGLREAMRADGSYGARRGFQTPIVAAILAIAGTGGLVLLYRLSRNVKGRRNKARTVAMVAALAMLFLMTLRMISLHAVDALLYGPIKINWLVDLGSSLTVMLGALYYVKIVRRHA